jgi:hypothetical protein
MFCGKHDTLRREWVAARADYQLALADLQKKSQADEFRNALKRANQMFAEFSEAEAALNRHLEAHGCASVQVASPAARFTQSVN